MTAVEEETVQAGRLNFVGRTWWTPAIPTIDLDNVSMANLRQAASQSNWMPPEYMANDWLSDVCEWLRHGPLVALPSAAADVFAERQRQNDVEGWAPKHDDEHDGSEMAKAAACYAYPEITTVVGLCAWPWHESWWKPSDERRNLVRAGALILAEIERLDRASDKASRHAAAEAWLK